MLNTSGFMGKMMLFVILITMPVAIVAYWLVSQDLILIEYAVLLSLTPIGPAVLIYNRLLREVSALTQRMGQEATDPMGRQITSVSLRAGLLPVNDFLLTMQQYKRVLARMFEDVKMQQEDASRLFNMLPNAALVLDGERSIIQFNQAATHFFDSPNISGDLTKYLRNPALLKAVDTALAGEEPTTRVEFKIAGKVARYVAAYVVNLEGDGAENVRVIVTLHDLTIAKKTEKMRVDFVANASHELRTPLAILIGSIETLIGPASNDLKAQARFLEIMRVQSNRMARLIDDLLSLSQIEMYEHTRPSQQLDLYELLRSVVQMLSSRANDLGKVLKLEMPDGSAFVVGEYDQLVQVFTNLADNALKYGRENKPVVIRVHISGTDVSVSVVDQGEGIPQKHLPRLTERFYRVDSDRSRKIGGTGLGLAIVKHIVQRHRGKLEIDSIVGKGSVFTVKIPCADPKKC